MVEEDVVRDEAGHGDDRPAGPREQFLVELVQLGNAGPGEMEDVQALEEIGDRPALQQFGLAGEERIHPRRHAPRA